MQTKLFLRNVDQARVTALELGNEPDLYKGPAKEILGKPAEYVDKWLQYADTLADEQFLSNAPALWQGLVLAKAGAQCKLNLPSIRIQSIREPYRLNKKAPICFFSLLPTHQCHRPFV